MQSPKQGAALVKDGQFDLNAAERVARNADLEAEAAQQAPRARPRNAPGRLQYERRAAGTLGHVFAGQQHEGRGRFLHSAREAEPRGAGQPADLPCREAGKIEEHEIEKSRAHERCRGGNGLGEGAWRVAIASQPKQARQVGAGARRRNRIEAIAWIHAGRERAALPSRARSCPVQAPCAPRTEDPWPRKAARAESRPPRLASIAATPVGSGLSRRSPRSGGASACSRRSRSRPSRADLRAELISLFLRYSAYAPSACQDEAGGHQRRIPGCPSCRASSSQTTTATPSDGIQALVEAMAPLGEVWVVAPEAEQSAASHAISIYRPLRIREVRDALLRRRRHAHRLLVDRRQPHPEGPAAGAHGLGDQPRRRTWPTTSRTPAPWPRPWRRR